MTEETESVDGHISSVQCFFLGAKKIVNSFGQAHMLQDVLGESNITEGNYPGFQRRLPFGEIAPLVTVHHNVTIIFVTSQ